MLSKKIVSNSVISRHIHLPIYVSNRVESDSQLTSENISLKVIEEMWTVIEKAGIQREVFGKHNPSFVEIRDLYLLVKQRQEPVKSKREVKI
jgi:hypothetical protein